MGGTYALENVVRLTIPEHAEAHHQLFLEHGRWQDFVAWQALTGSIGKDEILHIIHQWMARQNSPFCVGHVVTDNTRQKQRERKIGNINALGHQWIPSPETKQQMRVAKLGKRNGVNGKRTNKGQPWSQARRAAQKMAVLYGEV